MSKNTKHLPIYKAGYDLVKTITDAVRHFSRDFRPTLGATNPLIGKQHEPTRWKG